MFLEKETSVINGVQKPELCIMTEENPSSGTTEAVVGRQDIPWELFSTAAMGPFALHRLFEHNKSTFG